MKKHKAVIFLRNTGLQPLEKHKATDVRLSSDHLNDVSLADRWGPVLVPGYMFHRNTGTDPLPLLKKKYK